MITGIVSFALLLYQSRRGQRSFETAIVGLLAVALAGFVVSTIAAAPDGSSVVSGLTPPVARYRLAGAGGRHAGRNRDQPRPSDLTGRPELRA
ncbi:hypothetical protein ACIA58_19510 [Kribbella sp. NPDC051586]|uniref:hypothetical protein n=1 Tax=Kribbella sp. NPDC051586 TaxID=3364118 RepID=UPI0037B1756F